MLRECDALTMRMTPVHRLGDPDVGELWATDRDLPVTHLGFFAVWSNGQIVSDLLVNQE